MASLDLLQRLYEIVLAKSSIGPFTLFTRVDHNVVKLDDYTTLSPSLCSNILVAEETTNFEGFLAFFPYQVIIEILTCV